MPAAEDGGATTRDTIRPVKRKLKAYPPLSSFATTGG